MNPYSTDMMKVYYAFRALHQLDENCGDYINFASALPSQESSKARKKFPEQNCRGLSSKVSKTGQEI